MHECDGRCAGPRYLTSFGRRSFIQVGMLGGFGLTLADLLRASDVRNPNAPPKKADGPAKGVIQPSSVYALSQARLKALTTR